ncbi:MAG TPA: ZIP family metal transporter [Pirellulales bacterium]|nr:ZIP family metal transporter [Pirellulales bacterium]
MSQPALLVIYCASIVGFSLLGGILPHCFRLTHFRLQMAMSFVGGAMLSVGVLNMLPHAIEAWDGESFVPACWLLGGFLFMFFVERVFHFHHHDAPDEDGGDCDHEHHEGDSHHHHHPPEQPRRLTWGAALAGLVVHSALDGMALGASMQAEPEVGVWPGSVVFLAILLHKPFDSLTLGTLMAVAGRPAGQRHLVNFLYALAVPLGAILYDVAADRMAGGDWHITASVLAFSAGTFLCIATSDLLPELQFHSHDRVLLSVALIAGIVLAGIGAYVDHAGHAPHATHSQGSVHHHDRE